MNLGKEFWCNKILDFPQNFSFHQDEGERDLIGARRSRFLVHSLLAEEYPINTVRNGVLLELRDFKEPLGLFIYLLKQDVDLQLPSQLHTHEIKDRLHHDHQVSQARVIEHPNVFQIVPLLDEPIALLTLPPRQIKRYPHFFIRAGAERSGPAADLFDLSMLRITVFMTLLYQI